MVKRMPDGMQKLADAICGCGQPELAYSAAMDILEYVADGWPSPDYLYDDAYLYLSTNLLDALGLMEHGGGIGGSWLSTAGKEALDFLREYGEDWEDKGRYLSQDGCSYGR
jgi:hypothetical protein